MSDLDRQLRNNLYRYDCPPSVELGEYQLQMLPEAQANRIRAHLQACPYCRSELSQLAAFLQDVSQDLDYSLIERLNIWIAERMPGEAGGQSLAFGLRGDSGSNPVYDYQAGGVQITVEIQENSHAQRTLLGLALGIAVQGSTANLWQDGERLLSVPLDELGNFIFSAVDPGEYELILTSPDAEYHIQELRV